MGGGAGHMQDMISKIKQNRARREARKETRDKYNKIDEVKDTSKLEFVQVSENELELIKAKNREKARKERIKKNLIAAIVFVPIFIVVIYYLQKSLFMTLK